MAVTGNEDVVSDLVVEQGLVGACIFDQQLLLAYGIPVKGIMGLGLGWGNHTISVGHVAIPLIHVVWHLGATEPVGYVDTREDDL